VMTQPFWAHLLGQIADGLVVPIVGQDLLVLEHEGRSVTLYEALAEKLAARLLLPAGPTPRRSLNAVVYEYLESRPEDGERPNPLYIYSELKSALDEFKGLRPPEALVKLAAIDPLKLFVTTTFDHLLEDALRARRGMDGVREILTFSPEDPQQDLAGDWESQAGATVYQLFGQVSRLPFYAVTEEDTLVFVHALLKEEKERRPERLFTTLAQRDLLILGNSFPDWLARFFLRIGRGERRTSSAAFNKTDIVADTIVSRDPGLVLFLRHFSAQTRVYTAGGAIEFVDELYQRWTKANLPPAAGKAARSARPPSLAVPSGEDVSLFISYAREDATVARALKTALEKKNIRVWMDETEIDPGEEYNEEILRAIRDSVLFVALISKHTLDPEHRTFRAEWDWALDWQRGYGRAFILPVFIDDTPVNHRLLPPRFSEIHRLQMRAGMPDDDLVTKIRGSFRKAQQDLTGTP